MKKYLMGVALIINCSIFNVKAMKRTHSQSAQNMNAWTIQTITEARQEQADLEAMLAGHLKMNNPDLSQEGVKILDQTIAENTKEILALQSTIDLLSRKNALNTHKKKICPE